ncbi:hypothetical protein BDR26DRAFT_111717 [Obelidium mucronatum]|nr:hypothetical protein BDR26DRAFT_111717 [Obelidium mucronatum]
MEGITHQPRRKSSYQDTQFDGLGSLPEIQDYPEEKSRATPTADSTDTLASSSTSLSKLCSISQADQCVPTPAKHLLGSRRNSRSPVIRSMAPFVTQNSNISVSTPSNFLPGDGLSKRWAHGGFEKFASDSTRSSRSSSNVYSNRNSRSISSSEPLSTVLFQCAPKLSKLAALDVDESCSDEEGGDAFSTYMDVGTGYVDSTPSSPCTPRTNGESVYYSTRSSAILRRTLSSHEKGAFNAVNLFKEDPSYGRSSINATSGLNKPVKEVGVAVESSSKPSFPGMNISIIDSDSLALSYSDMKLEITKELILLKSYADRELLDILQVVGKVGLLEITPAEDEATALGKPPLKHANSWPPCRNFSQEFILEELQRIILLMINTNYSDFIGSARAGDYMRRLQDLLGLQHKRCVVDNFIEDLITRSLFTFASVSRASDSLNQYIIQIDRLGTKTMADEQTNCDENASSSPLPSKVARSKSSISKASTGVVQGPRPSAPYRKSTASEIPSTGRSLSVAPASRRPSTSNVITPSPLSSPCIFSAELVCSHGPTDLRASSDVASTPKQKTPKYLPHTASESSIRSFSSNSSSGYGSGKKSPGSSYLKPALEQEAKSPRPLRKLASDKKYESLPSLSNIYKDELTESTLAEAQLSLLAKSTSEIATESRMSVHANGQPSQRVSVIQKLDTGIEELKEANSIEKISSPKTRKKPVLAFLKMIFNNNSNSSVSSNASDSGPNSPSSSISQFPQKQRSITLGSINAPHLNGSVSTLASNSTPTKQTDSQFEKSVFEDEPPFGPAVPTALSNIASPLGSTATLSQNTPPMPSSVLCRICEEDIKSDQWEVHIKLCTVMHELNMQEYNYDQKLKKGLQNLLNRKSVLPLDGPDGVKLKKTIECLEEQVKLMLHLNEDREKKSCIQILEKVIQKTKRILSDENTVKFKTDVFEIGKKLLAIGEAKLEVITNSHASGENGQSRS